MAKAKKSEETLSPKKTTIRAKSGGAAAAPAEARTPVAFMMSEEQVRARAYELYLQRQGDTGTPEEDWFRAEAELRGKSA
jgi:hypothetical protein